MGFNYSGVVPHGKKDDPLKAVFDKARAASDEHPVFASVMVYDTPAEFRSSDELPILKATVAIRGIGDYEGSDTLLQTMVLDKPTEFKPSWKYSREAVPGDYLTLFADQMDISLLEPTKDLERKAAELVRMHETAPYVVHGRLYSELDELQTGKCEVIDGTDVEYHLAGEKLSDGSPVQSLDTAMAWVLENHPAIYEGCGIMQECPSGNFAIMAVPTDRFGAYEQGRYETFENRMIEAKDALATLEDRLGKRLVLGKETAKDLLANLKSPKAERKLPDIENILAHGNEREQQGELG